MSLFAKVAVPAPLTPIDTLLDYRIPENLVSRVKPGSLVELVFANRKSWGLVFSLTAESRVEEKKIRDIGGVFFDEPVFDLPHLEFLAWLSKHYFYPIGEVCETAIPAAIRKASAEVVKKNIDKISLLAELAIADSVISSQFSLNADQKNAVENIVSSVVSSHLLWGITGSGKTEVYLACIEKKIREGKSALVLVPEIALTPQLTNRFDLRFPGLVEVFHSGQKLTETRLAWLRCLSGRSKIAIGPRSALFAPLKNVGIVIVDEEHDGSYKQEDRLKYHARDAALALASMLKIPLVLGSATPSAETVYEVNRGTCKLSELHARAVELAKPPEIEIVDLKLGFAVENKSPVELASAKENKGAENSFENIVQGDFFLSSKLRLGLAEVEQKKEQAILFLNRRGIGSQSFCRACGDTLECPNCAVRLTPHRQALICHYCAYEVTFPKECPSCSAKDSPYIQVGVGTESIETALKTHFPKLRVLRMDRDSTKGAEDVQEIVNRFRNHEADVLIGTQMVAKGHDFPKVTLVGILLAEMGLAIPDFRAAERNYQLLLQVSGRAGRDLLPGKVILQTFQPENELFRELNSNQSIESYKRFIHDEIQKRTALGYPPVGRLALMRFDGLDADSVRDAAQTVSRGLKKISVAGFSVLGPVACPIFKIRNRYRWQVLLKSPNMGHLNKSIHWIYGVWQKEKLEKKFRTRLVVDVDPIQML